MGNVAGFSKVVERISASSQFPRPPQLRSQRREIFVSVEVDALEGAGGFFDGERFVAFEFDGAVGGENDGRLE